MPSLQRWDQWESSLSYYHPNGKIALYISHKNLYETQFWCNFYDYKYLENKILENKDYRGNKKSRIHKELFL